MTPPRNPKPIRSFAGVSFVGEKNAGGKNTFYLNTVVVFLRYKTFIIFSRLWTRCLKKPTVLSYVLCALSFETKIFTCEILIPAFLFPAFPAIRVLGKFEDFSVLQTETLNKPQGKENAPCLIGFLGAKDRFMTPWGQPPAFCLRGGRLQVTGCECPTGPRKFS